MVTVLVSNPPLDELTLSTDGGTLTFLTFKFPEAKLPNPTAVRTGGVRASQEVALIFRILLAWSYSAKVMVTKSSKSSGGLAGPGDPVRRGHDRAGAAHIVEPYGRKKAFLIRNSEKGAIGRV